MISQFATTSKTSFTLLSNQGYYNWLYYFIENKFSFSVWLNLSSII
jgi:hypothetical protein